MYAWHSSDPEEQIQLAKDTVEDMRRVLHIEGKTEEQIAARLAPVMQMIAAVEGDLIDVSESEEEAAASRAGAGEA